MGNSQGKPVVFTDQVNLNHFRLLRVVGKGAFGKVRIVERKDNGSTYALKYIRKDEVVRSESVRNIIRERRMLEHLNHPFLCNLRYSFQDVEYLYLVVDLMTGGDLRFHVSRKAFTEEAVRFWIAELGCALRYIHEMGIVHRDVKPDNVLLDAEGHVHLADFNVASEIKPGKELTSKSGTLAYLAPEVYEGRGYGTEVDWWSLGVVFYECIYNKRPFEASNHDLLGQKIVRGQVNYPTTNPAVSNVCLHAMSSLLEKDRRLRIGAASWESFWDNPFFRALDFNALEHKEIEPIFIPSTDKTNFDATYDLEELLLEEAPLEARARRQKPRSELKQTATEKEIREDELHRMIETLFEPFDFTLVQFDKDRQTSTAVQTSTASGGKDTPTSQYTGSQGESPSRHHQSSHGFSGPLVKSSSREDEAQALRAGSSSPVHVQDPRVHGRSRASTQSPNGSPPLPATQNVNFDIPKEHRDRLMAMQDRDRESRGMPRSIPDFFGGVEGDATALPIQGIPLAMPRPEMEAQRAERRPTRKSTLRTASAGKDQQSPLGSQQKGQYEVHALASDDWPQLMEAATRGPAGEQVEEQGKKPSGMLGFLSRKKGRDRSPKARERGVIGKEGARQIIGEKG